MTKDVPAETGILAPHRQLISELRWEAHKWLREQNFAEIVLPSVWTRSEEYGVEEFTLAHSRKGPELDLRLLQSPEFPLFNAMARGLGPSYTFGRCYRYEQDASFSDGNYLMEFEQLVFAQSGTTVEEMAALTDQLVIRLAKVAGIRVDPREFFHLGPAGLVPEHSTNGLAVESLVFLTFSEESTPSGREQLLKRLGEAGARVYALDGSADMSGTGSPAARERFLIETDADHRAAIEEIAGEAAGPGLNATWNIYPPFRWRPGEVTDSTYDVRSITSRREKAADGGECIADAELYLGGLEVIHIRGYADHAQFLENLQHAGLPNLRERYDYLLPALEAAPSGMVASFLGWERLVAVLLGLPSASGVPYFPRAGNGAPRW
ncbi:MULTISPECIES: amino acid--tRNA ligase-related protein [Streptomyces]|uniref:amino acid--tRNA ligase-related protein n=1 Tax=Streptomyces TaxID=1883 RepID=UPI0004CD99F3|nr:amino acid--tRNA ligase-related protein [Streptomyces durhamensis]